MRVTQLEPDGFGDFSVTYNMIKKGYAAIGLILGNREAVSDAVDVYRSLASDQNTTKSLLMRMDNPPRKLVHAIANLRRAARQWKPEPKNIPMEQDYANLVRMAYQDCEGPLATIETVRNVLERAAGQNVSAVAGKKRHEIAGAFHTIDRIHALVKRFSDALRPLDDSGIIVARVAKPTAAPLLGRVMKPQESADFEHEAVFWAITGLMSDQRDDLLKKIGEIENAGERESARHAFLQITNTVAGYAKHAQANPQEAIRKMEAYIPNCARALKEINTKVAPEEQFVIGMLLGWLDDLRGHGRRIGPT